MRIPDRISEVCMSNVRFYPDYRSYRKPNYASSKEFSKISKLSSEIKRIYRETDAIKKGEISQAPSRLSYDPKSGYSLKKLNVI